VNVGRWVRRTWRKYQLKRCDLERGLRTFFLRFLVLLPFPIRVLKFIPCEVCSLDILFFIQSLVYPSNLSSWNVPFPGRERY